MKFRLVHLLLAAAAVCVISAIASYSIGMAFCATVFVASAFLFERMARLAEVTHSWLIRTLAIVSVLACLVAAIWSAGVIVTGVFDL